MVCIYHSWKILTCLWLKIEASQWRRGLVTNRDRINHYQLHFTATIRMLPISCYPSSRFEINFPARSMKSWSWNVSVRLSFRSVNMWVGWFGGAKHFSAIYNWFPRPPRLSWNLWLKWRGSLTPIAFGINSGPHLFAHVSPMNTCEAVCGVLFECRLQSTAN